MAEQTVLYFPSCYYELNLQVLKTAFSPTVPLSPASSVFLQSLKKFSLALTSQAVILFSLLPFTEISQKYCLSSQSPLFPPILSKTDFLCYPPQKLPLSRSPELNIAKSSGQSLSSSYLISQQHWT